MVDEVDAAQEKEEIGLADAIRTARMGGPVAVATGRCLFCDEILDDVMRWCDLFCQIRWHKEKGMK